MGRLSLLVALLAVVGLARPAHADTITITFSLAPSTLGVTSSAGAWTQTGGATLGTVTVTFNANVTATPGFTSGGAGVLNATVLPGVISGSGFWSAAATVAATAFSGTGTIGLNAFFTAVSAPSTTSVTGLASALAFFTETFPGVVSHSGLATGVVTFMLNSVQATGLASFSGTAGLAVSPTATGAGAGTGAAVQIFVVGTEISRTFHDASPVPEPGTLLMVGLGLMGLGAVRFRTLR